MPKYALCAKLKPGCRDLYIEMHHHAHVASQLPDINRLAGVTKEQIFLFGDQIFLYGECDDTAAMERALAADASAVRWADSCDHTLMQQRSGNVSHQGDEFAPLLHVYDMDVLNGVDDAATDGTGTRRDLGAASALQARAAEADKLGWSAARGWSAEPEGVGQPSPPAWLDLAVGSGARGRTTTTVVTRADGSVVTTTTTPPTSAGL